ncbi:hypothetical protein NBRC116188_11540 [Oceaniserpentilla sp. 4NH20-0058]|uniref:hypothetical protein n=1 Tax=Oceaniserpentilla sp. 4NH20-0058 TaxID=3127660 RepID=UPI0031049D0A
MYIKAIFYMLTAYMLWGCGALDESSSTEVPAPTEDAQLTGLWVGVTQEQGTTEDLETQVLFINDTVYILREDEAHFGSYTLNSNGSALFETDVYTYNTPDTDNQFFVGVRGNIQLDMDALFATNDDLFINYEGSNRSGSITLELDSARENNLTLTRVSGQWDTTDSVMYINDVGGLQGSDSATGCQWKGDLTPLTDDLLSLSIERQLCSDFNQSTDSPVDGYALVDGEGLLHFVAQQPNQLLWMRFESSSTTTTTTTEEETTDETTEETTE